MMSTPPSSSGSSLQETVELERPSSTQYEVDQHWEDFFHEVAAPEDYDQLMEKVRNFISKISSTDDKIVLVSSGGTTVPLEQLTVRFIDNFSSGNRGAASTESFLEHEYHVIFLYRRKSSQPYTRHLVDFFDVLELDGSNSVKVKESKLKATRELLEKYEMHKMKLLMVPFVTLGDYLWLLKGISKELNSVGNRAMLYLAAAASDFYIPKQELPQHKINSDKKIGIQFSLVPKMLRPLTSKWAPNAFIVSFKLETNAEVLLPKARKALTLYNHNMVIANLLNTRKKMVTIVEKNGEVFRIDNPNEETEIEVPIVAKVVEKHLNYLTT